MVRVLVATGLGFSTGGVKSHIDTLRRAIGTAGHTSTLVIPDTQKPWWKVWAGLRAVGDIDRGRRYLTEIRVNNVWRKVWTQLKQNRFNVIHVHDVLLASRLPLTLDIPLVLTVHGPLSREAVMLGKGSHEYLSYLRSCEESAYERVGAIIAVDSGQKDIIVNDYKIDPRKIHVIYNAVDTTMFKPCLTRTYSEPYYYLVPRRLVPKNGVHVAIEAMRFLRDLNIELWIAGDGFERNRLEQLAITWQLERVRFLGTVSKDQMIPLMGKALGIIVPSVPTDGVIEASSIAALEGMSMEQPVIASNIGGLSEVIRNRETGLLFEAGNPEALATQIRKLTTDKHLRWKIGQQARKYVVENHSVSAYARYILGVYNECL